MAITLLTVAITAPMELTGKSLASAYYARDQITAFHLAQEAVESVRHVRDHNVLRNALGEQADLLDGILDTGQRSRTFAIDTRNDNITTCVDTCPPLQTDGELYGYESGWADTRFTRSVFVAFVDDGSDEVRVSVSVAWRTGAFQTRTFTISQNLYRWVNDGSGSAN